MKRESTRINFSIHPDVMDEVYGIRAELKNLQMPFSGTICELLKQFRDDGYQLKSGRKVGMTNEQNAIQIEGYFRVLNYAIAECDIVNEGEQYLIDLATQMKRDVVMLRDEKPAAGTI